MVIRKRTQSYLGLIQSILQRFISEEQTSPPFDLHERGVDHLAELYVLGDELLCFELLTAM